MLGWEKRGLGFKMKRKTVPGPGGYLSNAKRPSTPRTFVPRPMRPHH